MSAGFAATASVCPTTHEAVLSAVVRKLQSEIAEFASESTCFLCDSASPGVEVNEALFCTVAPADDTFDVRSPIGSADLGIVENAVIVVTVWSRVMLDRLDHASRTLTDSSRGLLAFKQRILRSLAGSQLYADAPANTEPLLIELLHPTRSSHPISRKGDDDLRSFALTFTATFNWDL